MLFTNNYSIGQEEEKEDGIHKFSDWTLVLETFTFVEFQSFYITFVQISARVHAT